MDTFGYHVQKDSVLDSCIEIFEWDVSERSIDRIYAQKPLGLADRAEVKKFMQKAKRRFRNMLYKGKISNEVKEFFSMYDGVLMNVEASVTMACLIATKDLTKLGQQIDEQTAKKILTESMAKFGVENELLQKILGPKPPPAEFPCLPEAPNSIFINFLSLFSYQVENYDGCKKNW